METVEVALVGGGSTGCSILYQLAKNGVKDSLLLDMAPQVGAGQTSRSIAVIRTHYSIEVLARMALNSYRFFKNFGDEVPGCTSGYVESGLIVGVDEGSEVAVRRNIEVFRKLGIDSRILDTEEIRRVEPMLNGDGFLAAIFEPNSGYAEPSTTTSSFASSAKQLGARVAVNRRVTKLERSNGVYLISTADGLTVASKKLVLATGVWSKPLFAQLGIHLPMKVVRHPVARLKRPDEYHGVRPIIFDIQRSAYYTPQGRSTIYVGSFRSDMDSSGEVDPDDYNQGITYEEATNFSKSASEALPIMASGIYQGGYSGLYDITPDQQPIIDELSSYGYPGLYCLVGLSGHGFKLAPEFGRIMSSLIIDEKFTEYDVSIFKLKRFEDGRLLRGGYAVSTIG